MTAERVELWIRTVERLPERNQLDWLDTAERARADRYHFERDRTRFLGRRVFLREILAGYLGLSPAKVRLHRPERGRPVLASSEKVNFNTSHSAGLAVVAVTQERPVGVDVERVRPLGNTLTVAEQLFCKSEFEALRSTPDARRARTFLRLWTRKESIAKATGMGLLMPLDDLDVLTADDGVGRPRGRSGTLPYAFTDFAPASDFVGTVATGGASVGPLVWMNRAL